MTSDVLLNGQLLGAMLPSPSVLTGNYQPQTAAAFVEQTLSETRARAACGSRSGTPAVSQTASQAQTQLKSRAEEVGVLRNMASKHLGQLRQTRPAPYMPQQSPLPLRCLSTPPQRPKSSAIGPPLTPVQQSQPHAIPVSPRDLPLTAAVVANRSSDRAASSLDSPEVATATNGLSKANITGSVMFVPDGAPPPPHPAISTCSSHPFFASHQVLAPSSLPRLVLLPPDDASTMATVGTLSPPSTAQTFDDAFPDGAQQQPPLSPSPVLLTPTPTAAQAQPHTQLQKSPRRFSHASSLLSRPTTSLSVQDLSLPKPGPRLTSRSLTRGSGTQLLDLSRTGNASAGGEAAPGSMSTGNGTGNKSVGSGSSISVASSSPTRSVQRFHHTATRWAEAAAAAQGSTEAARPAGFKVTRGMLYSVFQELDEFDSGRLTYSGFEQAACKIGMRPAQAKRLFERLDPLGRGYATMREWSSPHLQRQMEAFTRLYVQATRGDDGRPKDIMEVRSMHMAIQMAMVKLKLKRSGRAVSLNRLVQAFAFMDRDGNGALNAEEVEDALNSLGIFVTKEVVDTIMRTFDKDGNGCVDYYEFVKSLYPTLDSSVYHH